MKKFVFKCVTVLLMLYCFVLPVASQPQEMQLRVMTFNIWYGGEQFSFAQTAEVIRAANPDLVGVQEPDGNLRLLAEATGYSYVDEKRNIISRYPLFDPDTADRHYPFTRALVRHGQIVAFANAHLTSSPFGPDLLHDGKSVQEVIEVEKGVRLVEVMPYIHALREMMTHGMPVFFAGDFNSPSHQDWSKRGKQEVEWPVTKALAQAGLRDSYREANRDAVSKPGLTWTPGYPHPYRKPGEILERIDMIWCGGNVSTIESRIVGERNNPAVDIAVDPYPSDHRAVVSTFRVVPAAAPAMIAVDTPIVMEGSDFLVRFQTPDSADWGVFVVRHRGNPAKDAVVSAKGPNVMSTRPSFRFGSLGIAPGKYDAVLVNTQLEELSRTSFYIRAKHAVPELLVEKTNYTRGEPIKVSWRNAPGMKNDWVGIYRASDPDVYGGYIAFVYTGAKVEGSLTIDSKALPKPLEPGEYELRLMREDAYVMLAKTAFLISR